MDFTGNYSKEDNKFFKFTPNTNYFKNVYYEFFNYFLDNSFCFKKINKFIRRYMLNLSINNSICIYS